MPFGDLATAYGLLVMPRMPELKNRKITGFVVDTKKKANEIKYKSVHSSCMFSFQMPN